jgi:hypothetical protein
MTVWRRRWRGFRLASEQKAHMRLPNLKYKIAKPLANPLIMQESVLGVAGATGLEPAASAVTGRTDTYFHCLHITGERLLSLVV